MSKDTILDFLTNRKGGGWMGDPKRGAAMGRPTRSGYYDKEGDWVELAVIANAQPFHLRRIRLDRGGYDSGGAYWGHGEPLWGFVGPVNDITGYVRAKTRELAKEEIKKIHPHAKFFR